MHTPLTEWLPTEEPPDERFHLLPFSAAGEDAIDLRLAAGVAMMKGWWKTMGEERWSNEMDALNDAMKSFMCVVRACGFEPHSFACNAEGELADELGADFLTS
jgi:hypothetical protein